MALSNKLMTDTGSGTKKKVVPNPGVPLPEDLAKNTVPTNTITPPPAGGFTVPGYTPGTPVLQMPGSGTVVPTPYKTGPVPQVGIPAPGVPLPEDLARQEDPVQQPNTMVPGAPLPEDVERRKAELAGQVPLHVDKTIQEQQQDIKTDLDAVTTGVTGGGGTGTGGTGGGTSTTGGTTATKTSTGTTIEGEPATDTWQNYYKKATETQFQYNPAEDQEYLRAASVIEQQVTDMMVGRGGLYSSVAHAALQSRLMSLQVDYQKIAYDKYLEERDFNMQMAGFLADREDAEWEKNFKLAQFQADLEQQKFENNIKTAQLRIQQANAYASRAAAQAKAENAAKQTELAFMQADAQARRLQLEQVVANLQKTGVVDATAASYLAGDAANNIYGLSYEHPIVQSFIKGAYSYLDQEIGQIASYAKQIGDVDSYINALSGLAAQSEPADVVSQIYAQVDAARAEGYTYKEILSAVKADAVAYRKAMGSAEYNKLVDYIESRSYSLGR